jgi:anti-sigma regulatory factor (Ser/Thr protein kinase)
VAMPAHWSLPADLSAAGMARRHVVGELAGWPNVDDIELVASELTSNAVQHGGSPIDIALELIGGRVRIRVSSAAGASEPAVRRASAEDSHGRGLALVSALADEWGWAIDGGRVSVWADFTPSGPRSVLDDLQRS